METAELIQELRKRGVTELPHFKMTDRAECPRCGKRGPIDRDFGTRVMRGTLWPQSWCRDCRAGRTPKRGLYNPLKRETRRRR